MADTSFLDRLKEISKHKVEREFFRYTVHIDEFPDGYPSSYVSTHSDGYLCGFLRPQTNDIIVSFCPFNVLDDANFPYIPWFKGTFIIVPYDSDIDFCLEEFGFVYPFTRIDNVLPTSTSI